MESRGGFCHLGARIDGAGTEPDGGYGGAMEPPGSTLYVPNCRPHVEKPIWNGVNDMAADDSSRVLSQPCQLVLTLYPPIEYDHLSHRPKCKQA